MSRREWSCLEKGVSFRLKVKGSKDRRKRTWKKRVEKDRMEIGWCMENTLCRSKWIGGVNQITTMFLKIRLSLLAGGTIGFKH